MCALICCLMASLTLCLQTKLPQGGEHGPEQSFSLQDGDQEKGVSGSRGCFTLWSTFGLKGSGPPGLDQPHLFYSNTIKKEQGWKDTTLAKESQQVMSPGTGHLLQGGATLAGNQAWEPAQFLPLPGPWGLLREENHGPGSRRWLPWRTESACYK